MLGRNIRYIGLAMVMGLVLAGCDSYNGRPVRVAQSTGNTRFIVIDESRLSNYSGYVDVIKDNLTGECVASHLFSNGVMAWAVPCDQADVDKMRQQQMRQLMQMLQSEGSILREDSSRASQ